MFSSKVTENLTFVSRQLANLLDKEQIEPALQRLAEASPPEYARDVEYLRSILAGDEAARPGLGPNPYRALARLMPSVAGSKNILFREFDAHVQRSKIVFNTYWTGIVGLIWYLAAVTAVALVVAIVFGTSVIPGFGSMFSQFGAPLPAFTQFVFAFGSVGFPLVAVVLAVFVASAAFGVTLLHRRVEQLSPLPRWPTWAPIIGKIAESYNLGLFLNYTRMLRQCGVEPGQAIAAAAAAANQPDDLTYDNLLSGPRSFAQLPALTEIGIAARLGEFDSEISHQCDQHTGRLSVVLLEARDRLSLILKIALYFFVAALVVAMYLPIFQMGSVI